MKKEHKVLVWLLRGDANSQEIVCKTTATVTELSRMKKKGLITNNGRPRRGKTFIPSTRQLTRKGQVIADALVKRTTLLQYLGFALFARIR